MNFIRKYIDWPDSPSWNCRVMLGSGETYYNFSADWNSRDESFGITVSTLEGEVIIQGRKMVLNVDLLAHCYSPCKPDCILYPAADNENIRHITFNNMTSGEVRLYHEVRY